MKPVPFIKATHCLLAMLLILSFSRSIKAAEDLEYDLVVYGGTSAGVIAAVQAKKMGKSVIVIGPDKHLGGLSSGGLGWTDTGNKAVIGGLARDFYHRIWKEYQKSESWKWQKSEDYGNKGQGTPAMDGENRTMWIFEPSIAEKVFDDYIREFEIPLHRDEWLNRKSGINMKDGRIRAITMLSGLTIKGKMFVDATYEGDLMAAAGIDYHVGREGEDVYGEEWNGIQTGILHHKHHFGAVDKPVSPYKVAGDPSSGILPRISSQGGGVRHTGDKRVQAYCFRMCLSNDPDNRIPFSKPEGYDPNQYELLVRIYEAGWRETFRKFDPLPNHKTDTNNHGPFSTDNIGYNYEYPDASYEKRREIIKEHETYQKGWLYFIANDPRVPKETQDEMNKWGLPKDEFVDNGNWSHQLYIREARRMIGAYVMTEHELRKKRPTPDSVGMGSYTIDSHNVQRYITEDGYVQNEGDIGVSTNGPYQIAYGSLVPKKKQCKNLFVPVCVSSSHIAFGSIRMEPVFMLLGQSAATAAAMAIDSGIAVQDVDYDALKKRLIADGQVLEYEGGGKLNNINPSSLKGIVLDDSKAETSGNWTSSSSSKKFVGTGYQHDGNTKDGKASAVFRAKLPESGAYEVRFGYTANKNRSSKVAVTIQHATGEKTLLINEAETPPIDGLFISLGVFEFDQQSPASVTISNRDSDGYVVIDAVQWLPKK